MQTRRGFSLKELPGWIREELEPYSSKELAKMARRTSLFTSDLKLFCRNEKVPFTPRLLQAQAELRVTLENIVAGRSYAVRSLVGFDMHLLPAYDLAERTSRRLGLSASATKSALAQAAKRTSEGLPSIDQEELKTHTNQLLESMFRFVWRIDLGRERAQVRFCRLCELSGRVGYVFAVGHVTRSEDCEACSSRFSSKQRWHLARKNRDR